MKDNNTIKNYKNVVIAIFSLPILALILIPLFKGSYLLSIFITIFTYIILGESFDILAGYVGYTNLGHVLFFGISGYTFAILFKGGYSVYISWTVAAILPVIIAAAISVPFFRLKGDYFSIGTLVLAQLGLLIANNLSITGGSEGLYLPAGEVTSYVYYAGLLIVLITISIHYKIGKSRWGLGLRAIREDITSARSLGINVPMERRKALILSSIPPSLIGGLYVAYNNYIDPSTVLGIPILLLPVSASLFGGRGHFIGPLIGVSVLLTLQELLFTFGIPIRLLLYGTALLIVGTFMPEGLYGQIKKIIG
ncbi:hypothetical protein AKJ37_02255 [candidate division MSBL1 archaeon SCGC-AAA259I09]|uniref:Branched-chain amino acid ABC transporter permease n=1 Tax=candidate division MSBL1 archaeon SCGC-AAA259I09 TaxID=1698267 RepID=A0A133UUH3_9EURY|nr:hypothetical protein AKJ37_02255 [candidate division MSBL1 archaeon SCGC-AAA259I09]